MRVRAPNKQSTGLFVSPAGERRCPHLTLTEPQKKNQSGYDRFFFLVEEGGFGPPKSKDNRFTVCPLWPLGNSSILLELVIGLEPTTC